MTVNAWMETETRRINGPPIAPEYLLSTEVVEDPTKWTVEQLGVHLKNAALVEMSTIPLYLYAGYSIKGLSYSEWSPGRGPVDDFRTIVIEEMLHLCLVRNMLVSIGQADDFKFYSQKFIPTYPSGMLQRWPPLTLSLEPLTYHLLRDIFMEVEKPQTTPDGTVPSGYEYFTLGQFYDSLRKGFDIVNAADPNLFADTRPDLQYGTTYWNEGGGGGPVVITQQLWGPTGDQYILYPIGAVHKAIDIIVQQGEGIVRAGEDESQLCQQTVNTSPANPTPGMVEFTHYAKFCRMATGLESIGIALDQYGFPISLPLDQAVWPVLTNPTLDMLEGSARDLAEFFNAAFCYVLALIDEVFSTSSKDIVKNKGKTDKRYGLERTFIASMGGLLFPIADLLVRTPTGKNDGRTAGPPFGYYQYRPDQGLKAQLTALAEPLLKVYPSLGGDNSVMWLLSLLPEITLAP